MEITPLVLTYNEAPNIERTLSRLTWASRIVVVDSFSTDETEAICRRDPRVEFIQRKFEDHTTQWNFGLAQIKTEWVLTLDADYVLSDGFLNELRNWNPAAGLNAYFASFKYCVHGRQLRGSLYPPRAVLLRHARGRYVSDGHTQKLKIEGASGNLSSYIDHDDRKSLSQWLQAQDRYAVLEVTKLLASDPSRLRFQDRLRRKIVLAPLLVFFYTLLGKGLVLDGWPGWYYVLQRTLAEIILSLRLVEARLGPKSGDGR